MPTFDFTSPEGKTYSIEGPEGATREEAFQVLQAKLAAPQEDAPVTATGLAKAASAGAAKGTIGVAGAIGDVAHTLGDLRDRYISNPISRKLGLKEVNLDAPDPAQAIGSEAIQKQVEKVTGEFHKPQNTAEKYTDTIASFLPGVAGGGEGLASRLLTRAVVPGAASEAAGQATEGTAAEPYARVGAAVLGGVASARAAAARSAQKLQAMPTLDEVNAEKTRLYNTQEVKDLRATPQAVNGLGNTMAQSLEQRGFFREDHGGVFNAADRLRNASGPVSLDEIEAVKKALQGHAGQIDAFGRPTPTSAAANHAKSILENFIDVDLRNPANIASGNSRVAIKNLMEARQNAGAAIRSDQVSRLVKNAEVDASTANSGMNIQNRIRQVLKPFLKNGEAKMNGYNDEERAAMTSLVRGSGAMNALRYAGNAMGGSGMTVGPYMLFGHPAVPVAGYALKKLANVVTTRQANKVADKLLSRAPISQRVAATNSAIKASNDAARRHLMLGNALRTAALANTGQ